MNEYTLAEIEVGMKAVFHKTITKKMEDAFRVISGDENPLHKDDTFALEISNGKFQGHAAFGMLTASLYSTVAGMYLPGKYSLIHSFEELSFTKPLKLIRLKVTIKNQDNKLVSKAKMKVLVMK